MINEFLEEERKAQENKEKRDRSEMRDLVTRIEDAMARTEEYLAPIASLTPSSDLEDIKRVVNALLSFAKGDFGYDSNSKT